VPVGTVDKFQGQQAPISIYSMATSRPEDAPRGLEFLYSLNRLNVATSRARCLTLVVASPALVLVDARTPRQMELANALCRLVEVATGSDPDRRSRLERYASGLTEPELAELSEALAQQRTVDAETWQ